MYYHNKKSPSACVLLQAEGDSHRVIDFMQVLHHIVFNSEVFLPAHLPMS